MRDQVDFEYFKWPPPMSENMPCQLGGGGGAKIYQKKLARAPPFLQILDPPLHVPDHK